MLNFEHEYKIGKNQAPLFPSDHQQGGAERETPHIIEWARDAFIQQPLNGVTQLAQDTINKTTEAMTGRSAELDLLPTVRIWDAPETQEFGTAAWHTQQIGTAIGMTAFLLAGKGLVRPLLSSTEAAARARSAIGMSIKESAITGFTYESVFRPTQNEDNSFIKERLTNGLGGALTFGTLASAGSVLGKFLPVSSQESLALMPRLARSTSIGALSGIPAGLVSTEYDALRNGRALPDSEQLVQSTYGFAMTGGLLSAGHAALEGRTESRSSTNLADGKNAREFELISGADELQRLRNGDQRQGAMLKVREILADGKSIARTLFVQHNDGTGLSTSHQSADILAICDPAQLPENARSKHVLPNADKIWLNAGRNSNEIIVADHPIENSGIAPLMLGKEEVPRESALSLTKDKALEELKLQEHHILSLQDSQIDVYKLIRTILREQQAGSSSGTGISPEWQVFPTQPRSPADRCGADYLMVNSRTGEFHILDATVNSEKVATQKSIAQMRSGGVIEYDSSWFSRGLLDGDNPDAALFRQNLVQQLKELSNQPSLLKFGDTPFPDVQERDTQTSLAQVKRFQQWLNTSAENATETSDIASFKDYAETLRKTINFLEVGSRLRQTPEYVDSITKITDRVVLDWAVKQMTRGATQNQIQGQNSSNKSTASETDVRYYGADDILSTKVGEHSYVTKMNGILTASYYKLSNSETLIEFLKKNGTDTSQMKAVKKFLTGKGEKADDASALKALASFITGSRSSITNGGRVGSNGPAIIDELLVRCKRKSTDELLQLTPAPTADSTSKAQNEPEPDPKAEKAALELADFWVKEGFSEGGSEIDAENVDLALQTLIESKPEEEQAPLKELLQRYLDGDSNTTALVDKTIRERGSI
jgi:hypothetical protein